MRQGFFWGLATVFVVGSMAWGQSQRTSRRGPEVGVSHTSELTDCSLCHSPAGWVPAEYVHHAQTDFPLVGAHRSVACKACHRVDFKQALDTTCRACHRDAHGGRLGQHCETCHESTQWQNALDATAHRTSSFPLIGAHAVVPCRECHRTAMGRQFFRADVECVGCHQARFAQTAQTSIDHQLNGFGTNCQGCHFTWSFVPARFPAHDVCFELSAGPHSTARCQSCHQTLVGLRADGTCATNNADCTRCHEHAEPLMDQVHAQVGGYDYAFQKCYACHQFAAR